MATKALKDYQFCIENILNNLDFILKKFDIKVEKSVDGLFRAIQNLIDRYREQEQRNRNLHRLVDRILDEFNNIVNSVIRLLTTFEDIIKHGKFDELIDKLRQLETECAKNVRALSSVDVLSLEIDECTEMRWWKSNYDSIREIVYYLVWLTYYALMLALYLAYRHATDKTEQLQSAIISRASTLMLIHRALMR